MTINIKKIKMSFVWALPSIFLGSFIHKKNRIINVAVGKYTRNLPPPINLSGLKAVNMRRQSKSLKAKGYWRENILPTSDLR